MTEILRESQLHSPLEYAAKLHCNPEGKLRPAFYNEIMNTAKPVSFTCGQMQVHVYPSSKPGAPVVYLHGFDGYTVSVLPVLNKEDVPDFSLVAIDIPYDLWDVVLAPWATPEGWPQYVACPGGSEEYLPLFLNEIVPEAEKQISSPGIRILSGYSLAGLFAVWVLFKTDMFDKIAAGSPSLWFPGFLEWFDSHTMQKLPECVYFSCSDEEYNTDNQYLKAEKPTIDALYQWFKDRGVVTVLQLDPGNHYEHVIERMSNAIEWVLKN